jgi:hypothetical protein
VIIEMHVTKTEHKDAVAMAFTGGAPCCFCFYPSTARVPHPPPVTIQVQCRAVVRTAYIYDGEQKKISTRR